MPIGGLLPVLGLPLPPLPPSPTYLQIKTKAEEPSKFVFQTYFPEHGLVVWHYFKKVEIRGGGG